MKRLFPILITLLVFSSCVKDPLNQNTNSRAATPTPNACPNADGALFAVRSLTKGPDLPGGFPSPTITLGLGVGVFTDGGFSANPVVRANVGTVEANGTTLDYEGETYVNKPSATDVEGIDWSNGVNWSVSGGSGFPAFTHSPTNAFPTVTEITSPATVTRSAGYTLTCDAVTRADKVLFLVGDVQFIATGNVTSHTFSASDLSGLDAGTNFVQIVPYTLSDQTFGGKTICFVNETVQQLAVEIE